MAAAVGTVINASNAKRSICLMTGLVAASAAPTLANQGALSYMVRTMALGVNAAVPGDQGAFFSDVCPEYSVLSIFSTAGSGAIGATFVLWGFLAASGSNGGSGPNGGAGAWVQILTTSALSGTAPVSASQLAQMLGAYDRLYLQCSAYTAGTWEAWLTTNRPAVGR